MPSSFIDFKDNGFWARDAFVEAFQLLLFEEIDIQYGNSTDWLNEYKKQLALQSLPLIYGGMSMCLDETLTDESRTEIILLLIDRILFRISGDKDYFTGKHLNSIRKTVREYLVTLKEFDWTEKEIEKQVNEGGYGDGLPKNKYIRGFDLLRRLITGQISFKADSPITYWGD